jgi:hypothetical protein
MRKYRYQSLNWFEKGILNWKSSIAADKERVARMNADIARNEAALQEYEKRLERAKKKGLTEMTVK